jgi:hypothetical protein
MKLIVSLSLVNLAVKSEREGVAIKEKSKGGIMAIEERGQSR